MKGTKLKSKINGSLFIIDGEFDDNGRKFYYVLDMASGNHFAVGKEWFEKGIMQNLEVVVTPTEEGKGDEGK